MAAHFILYCLVFIAVLEARQGILANVSLVRFWRILNSRAGELDDRHIPGSAVQATASGYILAQENLTRGYPQTFGHPYHSQSPRSASDQARPHWTLRQVLSRIAHR